MIFLWRFQEVLLFRSDMVEGKLQPRCEEGGTCSRSNGCRSGTGNEPPPALGIALRVGSIPSPPTLGIESIFQPLQLGPGKGEEDSNYRIANLWGDYQEEPCSSKVTTEPTK